MANRVSVEFGGELNELKNSVAGMESYIRGWGDNVKAIGVGAFAAWGASEVFAGLKSTIGELGAFLKDSLGAFAEAAQVDAQLAAALKSTGEAAGFTAEELQKLASDLQSVTTFGDEAIKSAETLLLKFKNIKGDQFREVTALALDMATRMGGDATSAAQDLGRALNDPLRGMQLLERQGLDLTDSQKELIKSMTEVGDIAGAQNVLIDELQSLYGGAAAAAADAAGGGFKQIAEIFGDIKEEVGGALMPLLEQMEPLIKTLAQHFKDIAAEFGEWGDDMAEGADKWLPGFEDAILSLVATMEAMFKQLFGSIDRAKLSWLEFRNTVDEKMLGEKKENTTSDIDEWMQFDPGLRPTTTGLFGLLFNSQGKELDLTRTLFGDSLTGLEDADRAEIERLRKLRDNSFSFEEERDKILADLRRRHSSNRQSNAERGQDNENPPKSEGSWSDVVGAIANSMKDSVTQVAGDTWKTGEEIFKQFSKGVEELGKEPKTRTEKVVVEEGFSASFEDAQSLFKRIQSSAASTQERREERKVQLAQDQLTATKELVGIAREKSRPGQQNNNVVAVLAE